MRLFDPTFNVNPAVLSVAYSLDNYSENLEISSITATLHCSPWYNGRERGICWSYSPHLGSPVLRIVCFEHRNSDDICMLSWEDEHVSLNPPVGSDQATLDKAYKGGGKYNFEVSFASHEIQSAAIWILNRLKDFTKAHQPEFLDSEA